LQPCALVKVTGISGYTSNKFIVDVDVRETTCDPQDLLLPRLVKMEERNRSHLAES
jgi:hypothetical protein